MGLSLGIALTFYTSVKKGLKLKFRNFQGLIPTFAEVAAEKLIEGSFFIDKFPEKILMSAKLKRCVK